MKNDRVLKVALLSLIINFAYGVYNTAVGFVSHSGWFIALGVYFIVLSVTRFTVLQVKRKSNSDLQTEMFAKKFTGAMLAGISVTLVGTVVLSAIKDRGVKYHQIVMITIALYTFIKVTLAVMNLVKARHNDSPVIKTLRSISFVDAFVSVLSLQRSMLVSFAGMEAEQIRIFNILTGSGVSILVLLSGLYLLSERSFKMAKSKLVQAGKKVSDTVVGGYKKVEDTVVSGYTKIEDKFVDAYLTRDGETVEEAKERLKNQNK